MKRNPTLTVALCVLALLATLGGTALAARNTIIIGTTDQPEKLEPADAYDMPGWWTISQTHEGLLQLNPYTEEVEPCLATSWTISDDGLVYTFKLRQGVTFTDGAKFDADAVKKSFDRMLKLNGDPVFLFHGIKKVEVVDTYTVRITLSSPDSTFLAKLAFDPPSFIVSPNSFTASTAEATFAVTNAKGTIGTGPYRVAQYVRDQILVLEAYDKYWGPKPKTQRIIIQYFPGQAGASALAMAIRKGDIDIAWRTLNADDLTQLRQDKNLQHVQGVGGLSVRYAVFNVKAKPFDNPKIRQAFAYAVDRDTLVAKAGGGYNKPAYSMVPEGLPHRYETYPKRDLNKAKELLRSAGYSEQKKLAINLWYDSSGHYAGSEADVATLIKTSIEQTGMVSVTLQPVDWGTFVEKFTSGETGFFLLGWYPDYLDAENYLSPFLSTAGSPSLGVFYSNPSMDKLLVDVLAETDNKKRDALFKKIQEIMAQDVPVIPLWYDTLAHNAIAKKNIKGLYLPADMQIRLTGLEAQ